MALCVQGGASVSRLARDCGINAKQLTRWLRERGHGGRGRTVEPDARPPMPPAFVTLQTRLPNGVSVELRGLDPSNFAAAIEAVGSVRCSA